MRACAHQRPSGSTRGSCRRVRGSEAFGRRAEAVPARVRHGVRPTWYRSSSPGICRDEGASVHTEAGTRVSGQTPERTPTAAAGESATCVHVTADGRLTRRGRRGSRRPPPACQSAPLATVTRRGRAGLRGGTDGLPSPPRAAGADADGSGHGASECGASGGGDWTPAGPSQPRAPAPPALPGCFPRAGHVLGTQDEISGRAISVFPMPAPWLWRPPTSS